MSVFFNGRQYVTPATASMVNDSALDPQNTSVGNSVALVGRANGGQPKTVLNFGSPQEAQRVLVSGELYEAVRAAFDPSSETGGPQTVSVVRVDNALQALGTMKDAGGVDVIKLTSSNWGVRENNIQYKIETGSVSGLRVTTKRGNDYYTADNLERRAFSIQYQGAEPTATITTTATSVVIAAPAGTTIATIDLTQFKTIVDLVDRLNMVADIDANVLDNGYNTAALNGLDFVTAQDIKAEYVVRGDLQAVLDWLNGPSQDFMRAERLSGAGKPPAAFDWKFLTGGTDGLTTFGDWSAGFEALQKADVQWVTPISGDEAIRALADTHCEYMSTVALRERRAITGSQLNTTDQQAMDAAKRLNSARTSLVHIGYYNYDANGVLQLFPPYILAALIAGAFSGVNPGTPLTNKSIKVRGLERELRNPTDTDVLINGGVLCVEKTSDGIYKIVKSISTWLTSRNYARVEQSTGAALDFTSRSVRNALDVLRGAKGSPLNLQRAVSLTESALRELAKEEPLGPGVLVGDSQSPAYRNITASLSGDVIRVQFECSPAIPINYVLVSIYAVPYSGTASAS
ncbi:hypothetical protein [Tardiphaga sp. 862_B3_N1_1]|uniref:hypothetical protein n=1 Tax=Tardiphaga sp. 862_B3_N1_1 TaxID=3240763 RepID=UPI003F88786F